MSKKSAHISHNTNKSIYDQAFEILTSCFQNCDNPALCNITQAKAQSVRRLYALLLENPNEENEIRLAILHFYDGQGLGCFIHKNKKLEAHKLDSEMSESSTELSPDSEPTPDLESALSIITRIKNRQNNLYTRCIGGFIREHKELFAQLSKPTPSPTTNPAANPTAPDSEISESSLESTSESTSLKPLFDFVDTRLDLLSDESKREMIKTALRQNLGINARDGLFFKNGAMKWQKFDYELVKINAQIRKISQVAHINVLSNEDKKTLNLAMRGTDIHALMLQNTLEILKNDIDLTRVDNLTFNARFSFFGIQKLRIYLEGLHLAHIDSLAQSIYCMELVQKYAWVMYEAVAKELLELCAQHNAHALGFVEFYNGGSIERGDRAFKKPLIIDTHGNPWTLAMIQNALKNKANVEFDLINMEKKLNALSEQIHTLTSQITHNQIIEQEARHKEDALQTSLEEKNQKLRVLVDSKGTKSEITHLSSEINALISDKSNVLARIEEAQKNIATLSKEHIKLLESQDLLKDQKAYALRKNKEVFLQYDLLCRALGEAMSNGKELV